MGGFRLATPSSLGIGEAFADMPSSMKSYMKDGLDVLSRIPRTDIPKVAASAIEAVQSPYQANPEQLAKSLGLEVGEAGKLLSAASFLTVLVSGRSDSSEEVVRAAESAGLTDELSKEATIAFIRELAPRREALKSTIERSRIANQVLPSLTQFDTVVDLRLRLTNGNPSVTVPVVIVHLDTDAPHADTWFQMQKADVESLIKDLQGVLGQIAELETWLQGKANG
jgi:hypothetical protein